MPSPVRHRMPIFESTIQYFHRPKFPFDHRKHQYDKSIPCRWQTIHRPLQRFSLALLPPDSRRNGLLQRRNSTISNRKSHNCFSVQLRLPLYLFEYDRSPALQSFFDSIRSDKVMVPPSHHLLHNANPKILELFPEQMICISTNETKQNNVKSITTALPAPSNRAPTKPSRRSDRIFTMRCCTVSK